MKVEIINRKITGKYTNTWKLNNTWFNKEVSRETNFFYLNESENINC